MQLAGFYLVEARDLNGRFRLREDPAAREGSIEVGRPATES